MGECPRCALNKRAGLSALYTAQSSERGLDLLFTTTGAEHVCTAVPYQVYGFLEA